MEGSEGSPPAIPVGAGDAGLPAVAGRLGSRGEPGRRTRHRHVGLIIGAAIVLVFVVAAIAASAFHAGAYVANPTLGFKPPAWQAGGSAAHLLGTDEVGRDVFARLLYGIRISMILGLASVVVAGAFGLLIGTLAGYLGGRVDDVLMRTADAILAVPVVLLAISVIGAVGTSATALILVIASSQWMTFARVTRSETLVLRQKQFVTAEIALGARQRRVLLRHVVPHVLPNMIVVATLTLPNVILLAAGLDFLGLGIQPPTPSIGGMISDGLQFITNAPWLAIYPGIALMLLVVGINLLGDGLSEALER